MSKRILIIYGHPDVRPERLLHALANEYTEGARTAGHEIQTVEVATLDFPLLRSEEEWRTGLLPPSLLEAQDLLNWAEHIVIFFPLWLGGMPALLKGFLEQIARPGFALEEATEEQPMGKKLLSGRSARLVVTMGMPALVYRYFFRAHSVKALERNILGFVGIAPVHETLIGMVGNLKPAAAQQWLDKLRKLGMEGK